MRTYKLFGLLLVIITASCHDNEVKPKPDQATRVGVSPVKEEVLSIPLNANGILMSSEETKLSFKTGGIILKVFVEEGSRVKKGELLAALNLSEISANADKAQSSYEKAMRDFHRADNLYRDSVVTLEQKQNAATALDVAKSTLAIAQFNLAHSKIIAPDNGLILRQFARENELVSAGYPVILFGTSGKNWKVRTAVADRDIIKIDRGDSAIVTFDAYPGIKFTACVDQVGEISNPYTGTYEVELSVSGSDRRLASGFVAGVELFPSAGELYYMIPIGSLVEADGKQGYVYVVTEAMTARKVKVDIVTLAGNMAAINGIPEGTNEVVSEGAAYLKDGMKVEVVR